MNKMGTSAGWSNDRISVIDNGNAGLWQRYTEFTSTVDGYAKAWGEKYSDMAYILTLVAGLSSEVGELAGIVKKLVRDSDGQVSDEDKLKLVAEIGDVFWYLSRLTNHFGFPFDSIVGYNIDKLSDRRDRNVMGGSGDFR